MRREKKGSDRAVCLHDSVAQGPPGGREALLHPQARITRKLTLTARQSLSEASRTRCSSIREIQLHKSRAAGSWLPWEEEEMGNALVAVGVCLFAIAFFAIVVVGANRIARAQVIERALHAASSDRGREMESGACQKSGRKRCRGMPVTRSTSTTRLTGTFFQRQIA